MQLQTTPRVAAHAWLRTKLQELGRFADADAGADAAKLWEDVEEIVALPWFQVEMAGGGRA